MMCLKLVMWVSECVSGCIKCHNSIYAKKRCMGSLVACSSFIAQIFTIQNVELMVWFFGLAYPLDMWYRNDIYIHRKLVALSRPLVTIWCVLCSFSWITKWENCSADWLGKVYLGQHRLNLSFGFSSNSEQDLGCSLYVMGPSILTEFKWLLKTTTTNPLHFFPFENIQSTWIN